MSQERASIEFRDCRTSLWTAATGRWEQVLYETPAGGDARIGELAMGPAAPGPPPIMLGMDGGRVYLYSITARP